MIFSLKKELDTFSPSEIMPGTTFPRLTTVPTRPHGVPGARRRFPTASEGSVGSNQTLSAAPRFEIGVVDDGDRRLVPTATQVVKPQVVHVTGMDLSPQGWVQIAQRGGGQNHASSWQGRFADQRAQPQLVMGARECHFWYAGSVTHPRLTQMCFPERNHRKICTGSQEKCVSFANDNPAEEVETRLA